MFQQIGNEQLPTQVIYKLASSGALIAAAIYLEHWTTFIPDLIKFMEGSPLHLRNGMIVLEKLPEEMKYTNRIKHGLKLQIRDDLLTYSQLLC